MDKSKTELSSIRLYGRLLSYVLPYIPLFLISILGFAVYSGSQVAATEWLKRVIDYVNNPEGDLRLVLPMALIAIAFVRGIGFFVGNYLLSSISKIKFAIKSCESIIPEVSEYKAEKQFRLGSIFFKCVLFLYFKIFPFF